MDGSSGIRREKEDVRGAKRSADCDADYEALLQGIARGHFGKKAIIMEFNIAGLLDDPGPSV